MGLQLGEEYMEFLRELEAKLRKTVAKVGGIDHEAWRSFESERRVEPAMGFVGTGLSLSLSLSCRLELGAGADGDLIEELLDLGREGQAEVAKGLELPPEEPAAIKTPATAQDLVKIVEDLSRIH